MAEEKSIKKNILYSVMRSFLSLIFPLITFPYASRILLPEGIGKVNFANSVVSYFVLLAGLGIGGYATREAARIKNDRKALTKFVKEIYTIILCSTTISYIIFISVILFVPKFHEYRNLLLICSIKIFLMSFGIEWLFTALEEFRYMTRRSFIFQIISLAFLFLFVRTKEDTVFYAIFGIMTSVGSNLCNIFHFYKYIDFSYKPDYEIKKHLKAILIFSGISFVTSIYTMLDTSMLGILSNNEQVGFYAAGNKINHMVLSLLTAITAVLLPRLSQYFHNADSKNLLELSRKSFNVISLLSIPLATGLFLLSESFILLISGETFLPAAIPMKIISPVVFMIGISSITGAQILPAIEKERVSLIVYVISSVANITANMIFIPKHGAIGAAIGTLTAESLVTILQVSYLRSIFFSKQIVKNMAQVIIGTTLMSIPIILLKNFIQNPAAYILASFVSGVLVYGSFLKLVKNEYFEKYVFSALQRRRK